MGGIPEDHLDARLRRLFGDAPCRLQVAALPWRLIGGQLEIMLITSRDSGRWIVPKGWTERDEENWQAAAREAREEAGVKGRVLETSAGKYYYAKLKRAGRAIPCEVMVFPLEVSELCSDWKERGERRRRWFNVDMAASLVAELDLAELIRDFARSFKRAA